MTNTDMVIYMAALQGVSGETSSSLFIVIGEIEKHLSDMNYEQLSFLQSYLPDPLGEGRPNYCHKQAGNEEQMLMFLSGKVAAAIDSIALTPKKPLDTITSVDNKECHKRPYVDAG